MPLVPAPSFFTLYPRLQTCYTGQNILYKDSTMRRFTLFCLLLILTSCSSSMNKRSKTTDNSTREKALKEIEAVDAEKRMVFFFRKKQEFRNSSIALFVNEKMVGTLGARQFTKIELPFGKHLVSLSFSKGNFSPSNKSASAKRMRKVIHVKRNKTGPMLVLISTLSYDHRPNVWHYFLDKERDGNAAVQKALKAAQYTLPNKISIDSPYVTPGEKKEWGLYANTNSINSLNNFIRKNPNSAYLALANERREELVAEQKEEFAATQKSGTLNSYGDYLNRFPEAHNRHQVELLMVGKMSKPATYNLYAETHPELIRHYPAKIQMDYKLMRIGPTNMQLKDILSHYKGGLGFGMLAAKIKATNAQYKNFSIREIKHLKKKGFHDKLIEAMIDSTAEFKRQMKATQQNKQMMAQIQALIKKSQVNVGRSSRSSVSGANKNMPVECLKLKAALVACKQAGGFLAMACKATARASFSCNMKI
jgi:hypothetical protein